MTFANGLKSNSTVVTQQSTQKTQLIPMQSKYIQKGKIQAKFSLKNSKTILTEREHHAPLKIAKTFHLEQSGCLSVYMMDASPGMMDGDDYEINMKLEDQCEVFLTNQSYTKIHPTPNRFANMIQTFHLGKGAVLEYIPEPTIPYANSRFQSSTVITLNEGATLFFAEVTLPGRLHRGELFQFESFCSRLKVYRDKRLVGWEHIQLHPTSHNLHNFGCLEHYTHFATFWIFSDEISKHLPALLEFIHAQLSAYPDLLGGVSLTCEQDICVRMLGTSTDTLQQVQTIIWNEARKLLLKKPAYVLRK